MPHPNIVQVQVEIVPMDLLIGRNRAILHSHMRTWLRNSRSDRRFGSNTPKSKLERKLVCFTHWKRSISLRQYAYEQWDGKHIHEGLIALRQSNLRTFSTCAITFNRAVAFAQNEGDLKRAYKSKTSVRSAFPTNTPTLDHEGTILAIRTARKSPPLKKASCLSWNQQMVQPRPT